MRTVRWMAAMVIWTMLACAPRSTEADAELPAWLRQKIVEIESGPVRNPPTEIRRYEVDGATYFTIPDDCCDQYVRLYDARGVYVCAPSGGITGRGDGQCPDWTPRLGEGRVVWKIRGRHD